MGLSGNILYNDILDIFYFQETCYFTLDGRRCIKRYGTFKAGEKTSRNNKVRSSLGYRSLVGGRVEASRDKGGICPFHWEKKEVISLMKEKLLKYHLRVMDQPSIQQVPEISGPRVFCLVSSMDTPSRHAASSARPADMRYARS